MKDDITIVQKKNFMGKVLGGMKGALKGSAIGGALTGTAGVVGGVVAGAYIPGSEAIGEFAEELTVDGFGSQAAENVKDFVVDAYQQANDGKGELFNNAPVTEENAMDALGSEVNSILKVATPVVTGGAAGLTGATAGAIFGAGRGSAKWTDKIDAERVMQLQNPQKGIV